ncbi:YqeG family HAD IIIA-type phosphatase [Alicyclobacillus sp.]|uniref:YqeG family HAD IIIA-type phosphatase n=1 Tax=Alicyclobacillus sp. TaxID=61169 RepID=UPI0025B7DAA1|nr:YqeG family HAD IIIA-type phosphatase [Alicyclobacillus sp.]MCL6515970.1 YqeG family HAD IIIA-type phosphatase [Alicyclobacillus sp.]
MSSFWERWMPNEFVASVHEIDLTRLRRAGRRLILCDLDNTLVPWNDPDVPEDLRSWIARGQAMGFTFCIVSNNRGPRVQRFAEKTGLPHIAAARKPKPEAFEEAMRRFSARPEETVMVGDQLLTDVRGGNRCGAYTILVAPIHPREWWGTRLVRIAERFVMRRLLRRGLQVPHRGGGRMEGSGSSWKKRT